MKTECAEVQKKQDKVLSLVVGVEGGTLLQKNKRIPDTLLGRKFRGLSTSWPDNGMYSKKSNELMVFQSMSDFSYPDHQPCDDGHHPPLF